MRKHLIIIGIFLFVAIAMTFPLIFKINTYMPGFFSTDESYAPVWNAWWLKFCFANHIHVNPISYIACPFGFEYLIFGYLFFSINLVLALLTNPVFTYNFQILANFILAAFFTYLLVLTITKNRFCALLSGLIFGFCPYIFVRGWQHLSETYLWMTPMALWLLFALKEKSTRARKILFVASIILSGIVLGTAYYTVVIIITFLCYFIARVFMIRQPLSNTQAYSRDYFKNIILLLCIGYGFSALQYWAFIKNAILLGHTKASAFNPYHRSFDDLFAMSAKPLSYFLPSSVHPLFGKFTQFFVGSELYGKSFTEHTLYLGWVPMILAFAAFRRWRRNRKAQGQSSKSGDSPFARENFYIGFFIFLAIVAWLFSQPPWWKLAGLKLYMPSSFMYNIIPMFRAYCRFGIVLMLAVAVLAGFGLKSLLEKFKAKQTQQIFTALCCGLVLFEFWNWPPYKVIDVSRFSVAYYWLKEQPKDTIIAEYPLDADSPNETYRFYQIMHEKKIINFTIPGTEANRFAQAITELSSPYTAGILKWMGVKYVLVHEEGYKNTEQVKIIEELNKIPKNQGLRLVRTFLDQECPNKDIMCLQNTGPIEVYEVVAEPKEPVVNK